MANKRFVKPLIVSHPIVVSRTIEEIYASQDKLARNEYAYCLAEAKRSHPDWTLAQRQAYARNAAQSLFD